MTFQSSMSLPLKLPCLTRLLSTLVLSCFDTIVTLIFIAPSTIVNLAHAAPQFIALKLGSIFVLHIFVFPMLTIKVHPKFGTLSFVCHQNVSHNPLGFSVLPLFNIKVHPKLKLALFSIKVYPNFTPYCLSLSVIKVHPNFKPSCLSLF